MNVGRTTPSDFDPCFHTGSEAGAAAEVIDSDIEALNNEVDQDARQFSTA